MSPAIKKQNEATSNPEELSMTIHLQNIGLHSLTNKIALGNS